MAQSTTSGHRKKSKQRKPNNDHPPPLPAAPPRYRDTGGDAMRIGSCYWRFKGEKEYRYGYATHAERGLWRMGLWNGDTDHGPFVDPYDIEVR